MRDLIYRWDQQIRNIQQLKIHVNDTFKEKKERTIWYI